MYQFWVLNIPGSLGMLKAWLSDCKDIGVVLFCFVCVLLWLICFVSLLYCCYDKQHYQKQCGRERIYFIFYFQVIINQWRKSRQDSGRNWSRNGTFPLAHTQTDIYRTLNHHPRGGTVWSELSPPTPIICQHICPQIWPRIIQIWEIPKVRLPLL